MSQGTRPWPVAVISAHLTAAPLLPGAARSDLAGADPVFARALAPNTLPSDSTAAPTSPPPWPASYSTPKRIWEPQTTLFITLHRQKMRRPTAYAAAPQ